MANTKKAATKAAATKKAVTKKAPVVEEVKEDIKESVIKSEPVIPKTAVPEKKKRNSDDFIMCRSVTYGELVYMAPKSGILYTWAQYGDETEVQYSDLQALYLTKSPYLFNPWIIVEDPELVAEWTKLHDVYAKAFKYEDTDAVLALPQDELVKALSEMPIGMRDSFKTGVADRIEEGTFDSMKTVKTIDQIMGTDFHCLFE